MQLAITWREASCKARTTRRDDEHGAKMSGERPPQRDKRGWLTPVGERYELLASSVQLTAVAGIEPFNAGLLASAELAVKSLEETGAYNVGLAIQMLDEYRSVHSKFVAAIVAERVKDRAYQK